MENANSNKVFISYSHKNTNQVDLFDRFLRGRGVNTMRDVRDVKFMDSITAFMDKITQADLVLIVLSPDYLKSYYCLYEIIELMRDKKYLDKIHPIVLKNTKIFREEDKLEYIKYWTEKYNNLYKKCEKLSFDEIPAAASKLKKIRLIRLYIGEFLDDITSRKLYTEDNLMELVNTLGIPELSMPPLFLDAIQTKDKKQREVLLEKFLVKNPDNSFALLTKAEAEIARKEYLKAEVYLVKAIQNAPNMWIAWVRLGQVEFELKKYIESEQIYLKAIEINDENPEIYVGLALTQKEMGKLEDALNNFQISIKLDPENSQWYHNLGLFYDIELNNTDLAIKNYEKAIMLNPKNYECINNLATLKNQLGFINEAEGLFLSIITENPLHLNSTKNLIELYIENNKCYQAKDLMMNYIHFQPKDFDMIFSYLHRISKVREVDKLSYEIIELSSKYNSKDSLFNFGLGEYFEDIVNDYEKANKYYFKAISLNPNSDMLVDYTLFLYENKNKIPSIKPYEDIMLRVRLLAYLKRAMVLDKENERAYFVRNKILNDKK